MDLPDRILPSEQNKVAMAKLMAVARDLKIDGIDKAIAAVEEKAHQHPNKQLNDLQRSKIYDTVRDILTRPTSNEKLSIQQRKNIADSLLHNLANPNDIKGLPAEKGELAARERAIAQKDPAAYANLIRDVTLYGISKSQALRSYKIDDRAKN